MVGDISQSFFKIRQFFSFFLHQQLRARPGLKFLNKPGLPGDNFLRFAGKNKQGDFPGGKHRSTRKTPSRLLFLTFSRGRQLPSVALAHRQQVNYLLQAGKSNGRGKSGETRLSPPVSFHSSWASS